MTNRNVRLLMGGLFLISVIVLLGLCGWSKWLLLRVHIASAEEQTSYFEESLRLGLNQQDPAQVEDYVRAIRNYYPSGTKQAKGTHIDRMVERTRAMSIQELEMFGASIRAATNSRVKL
jgi:hypothetical protein